MAGVGDQGGRQVTTGPAATRIKGTQVDGTTGGGTVRMGSPEGRWVLLAAILGSSVAMLDATVVNVALPTIGEDLDAGLSGLQWTLNGYLLTLAALILLGGSLGDRYGRRRVFIVGVIWFALASLLCGLAPNVGVLTLARALQGVGGALLTPGSLAIIQSTFHPDDRAPAIGAWSGLGGVATAMGPLVGGWLVDAASWRLIFLINLPLAAAVVVVALRHVPESHDPSVSGHLDLTGALLGAVGLAGTTYALIEGPEQGWTALPVVLLGVGGVLALVAFVVVERASPSPMLPLDIFSSHQFSAANAVTFVVYAALGVTFFFLVVTLQVVLGYSPIEAGLASIPVTVLMLLLSARAGRLATRIGPRRPMTAGPLLAAVGLLLMSRIGEGSTYVADVFPAVVVFGLGLSLTVAPLTATVLAAADVRHAGIASGVNNAVARVAGLVAVAVVPVLAGLSGDDYRDPASFSDGFQRGMLLAAAMCAAGGVLAWFTIRDDVLAVEPGQEPPADQGSHCAMGAPPLRAA